MDKLLEDAVSWIGSFKKFSYIAKKQLFMDIKPDTCDKFVLHFPH